MRKNTTPPSPISCPANKTSPEPYQCPLLPQTDDTAHRILMPGAGRYSQNRSLKIEENFLDKTAVFPAIFFNLLWKSKRFKGGKYVDTVRLVA